MNRGLRLRIVLLALLPGTLVAAVLTAVFLLHEIDSLEQGLRTRGTAVARHLAGLAEFGIFAGQRDALGALSVAAMAIDPDARGAAIVEPGGEILGQGGEIQASLWPKLGRVEGGRLGSESLIFIEPVLARRLPVDDIYGGVEAKADTLRVVGYAVLEMSLREVSARIQHLALIALGIALAGAALGSWFAWRIGRTLARPLLAAVETVERIGRGDLAARMTTGASGPLRSLANGINDMATHIGVTQEELRRRVAEATAGLQREKEAAERATQAKSHFLAAASHDLRQPLHALGLFVSALAQSDAAKSEPVLVGHVRSATDTLQNLLDAILDVSRLDSGNVVPRPTTFALGPVLERIRRDLSLIAEHKGLQLRVRGNSLWLHSDQEMVQRIVLNLVGNALRYTRSGGVLVAARRRGGMAQIEVWDTGSGIPEAARDAIFEEYTQLENPERDRAKGLGLGLAICRRLADVLDAQLGLRSRPGNGSVFWIRLPLAAAPPAGTEPASAEVADEQRQIAGTVIVVDGDPLVRTSMETAISSWGAPVVMATNCEEAIEQCRQRAVVPAMAICSLRLPGAQNGIDVAVQLRARFPDIGILLVSTDVSEETLAAARAAGLSLLKQPVAPGRLRAALRMLLPEGV